MRTTRTILGCILGVFMGTVIPVSVRADDSTAGAAGSNEAESPRHVPVSSQFAKQIFIDAMKQKEAGNLDKACDMFFTSYRILPRKVSAFQLASCWEEQGRTRSAQKIFLEVAKISKREGDQPAAEEALERAKALETRHSTLVINVSPKAERIPGLSIRLDDALVPPSDWNRTHHPVDSGERFIMASAPGYENYRTSVRIEKTTTARHVDIPVLVALASERATAKTLPPSASNPATKEWLLMLGGGSLAALGGLALIIDWPKDQADTFQTIGIAALSGGAVGLFWGMDMYRTRQSFFQNTAIVPLATPTSLGFTLNGHF